MDNLDFQALEPRLLLDAAAAITLDSTQVDTSADGQSASHPVSEDTSFSLDGVSVSDGGGTDQNNDGQPEPDQYSLDLTLNESALEAGTYFTQDGQNRQSITLTGTKAEINAALAGITVTPGENYTGDLSVSLVLSENGVQRDTATYDAPISPVNDAPTFDVGDLRADEGGSLTFTLENLGLSDPDIDSGDQSLDQLILQIDSLPEHGTLRLNGAILVEGSTFDATQLGNLVYTHDGVDVAPGDVDGFNITVFDGAGASTSKTLTVALEPINQAPSIEGNPSQYEGETTGLGLTYEDRESGHADAPGNVTIEVDGTAGLNGRGQLFLDLNGNGVVDQGEALGDGDTFTADQLQWLSFAHDGDEPGAVAPSFTLRVTDNGGGEGPEGALTSERQVDIQIRQNNDDPTLTPTPSPLDASDTHVVVFEDGMLDAQDPDSSDSQLVYSLTGLPEYGQIQFNIGGVGNPHWVALTVGGTFSQADINAGLVRYVQTSRPAEGVTQDTGLRFQLRDSEYKAFDDAGEPGQWRDENGDPRTGTLTFDLDTVFDGEGGGPGQGVDTLPVVTGDVVNNTGAGGFDEGDGTTLTGDQLRYHLEAGDYPLPDERITYTLTGLPANGQLLLDGAVLGIYDSFTQADVEAGRVTFQHDGGENHQSGFSFIVTDGGAFTDTGSFSLDATPVNDAPVTGDSQQLITEATDTHDGIVGLGPDDLIMSDPDGSEDVTPGSAADPNGEAGVDPLWFQITSLPAAGTLQRWTGSEWVDVALDGAWYSRDLLTTAADGTASGLRYVHDGGEVLRSDAFQFVVRDDLGAPADALQPDTTSGAPAAGHVSEAGTVGFEIAPLNDAPIINAQPGSGDAGPPANEVLTVGEGDKAVIGNDRLSAYDSDNSTRQNTFRVTENVENGKLLLNGKVLQVGGTFTQADIDAGRVSYEHDGSENHADSFKFVVSDGPKTSAEGTFEILVDARNDAPTVDATPPADNLVSGSPLDLGEVFTIGDADLTNLGDGETDFITVDLRILDANGNPVDGADALLRATLDGSALSGASLQLSGTLAEVRAALATLTVEITGDLNQRLTVEAVVDDRLGGGGANGGAANEDGTPISDANNTDRASIDLIASTSNDAPVATLPDQTFTEDTPGLLQGLDLSDLDAFDEDLTVVINVGAGALSVAGANGLTVSGGGTGQLTLTGRLDTLRTALENITYTPAANDNGTTTLSMQVTDSDLHGNGTALSDSVSATLTLVAVNDKPSLTVPGTQTFDHDGSGSLAISGVSVADNADSGQDVFNDNQSVTVEVLSGANDAAGLVSIGAGPGATSLTLTGTLAEINAQLADLTFTPDNTNADGTARLRITFDDRGNGDQNADPANNETVSKIVRVNISGTNDAPVISGPGDDGGTVTVAEDGRLDLSGYGIADPDDFGGSGMSITLSVDHGTFDTELGTLSNGGRTLTLTGATEAQLNALLDQAGYRPDGDYYGADTLTITVNDGGNTGTGGALQDSITVNLDVTPVNDRPVADGDAVTLTPTDEDGNGGAGQSLGDLFGDQYNDGADDQSDENGGSAGSEETPLSFIAITGNDANADQGVWQIRIDGDWVDVSTALSDSNALIVTADTLVRFQPAADFNGQPGGLTVRLGDNSQPGLATSSDGGDTFNLTQNGDLGDQTGVWSATATALEADITAINDAPTVTDGSVSLPDIDEDSSGNGHSVADLAGDNFNDDTDDQTDVAESGGSSADAFGGIAIIDNPADANQGRWQYNTGSGWVDVPSDVSVDNALVLGPDSRVRFLPAADYHGTPDGLSYVVAERDGNGDNQAANAGQRADVTFDATGIWSDSADAVALGITVKPVNDAPELGADLPTEVVVVENEGLGTGSERKPLVDAGTVTLDDVDGDDFGGGTITVTLDDATAADVFSLVDDEAPGIASLESGNGSLTIHLAAGTSAAQVTALIEALRYENTSDAPDTTTRDYRIVVNDGNNDGQAGGPQALDSNTLTGSLRAVNTNDLPQAVNDQKTTTENSTTTGNVLTNDSDPDGDDLIVSQVGGESSNVGEAVDGGDGGRFTINQDGSYSFDPNGDFDDLAVGESRTTSIEYQVSDGEGGFDTATLTITVTGLNDAPTVVTGDVPEAQSNDDSDTITPLDVSGAFTDVDGSDTLTYSANGLPPGLSINTSTGVISGTLERDASQGGDDGTYTVTVTASDGNGGTVNMSFDWTVSNPAPEASNDTATTNEDTATTGNVLTNDNDPDGDDLTVSQVNGEAGDVGEAVDGSHGGRFTLNEDGSYSFDPDGDFDDLAVGETRTTSIEYQVSDGEGGFDTATLTITVTGVNDAPVAVNDTGTTTENSTTSGNVLTNDSDPEGDTLTVSQVGGEATDVGEAVDGDNGGRFTINEDGSYSFDPNGDFDDLAVGESRTTSIEYQISDGEGGFDTATLTITVTGVNDAPTVVTGDVPEAQSNDDSDVVNGLDVSGAFSDVDGSDTLTYSANGLPPGLSINATTGVISGTLERDASQGGDDGTYTVTVTASDGNGGSVNMSFDWTVSNPAPDASNDTGTTTENSTTSGNVLTNDSDPDGDDLTVSAVNGEATDVGEPVNGDNGGRFILNEDGSYSFDPNGDFDDLAVGETRTTSIDYQVSDGEGGFDTATLKITVTGLNDAPTVVTGDVPEAQSNDDSDVVTGLDVSGAFSDVDGSDTLTYSANGLPPGLSINASTGVISGTLERDASQGGDDGTYTVTVTASDGHGGTVNMSFDWTVSNPAPDASNDTGTTTENSTTSGNVLTNDSDPDGDDLTVSAVNGEAADVGEVVDGDNGGRFILNEDGSYSFDPNGDFDDLAVGETRTTSIDYQVSDGEGGFDTATLKITVTGVNDAPTVVSGDVPEAQSNDDSDVVTGLDVSGAFTDVDDSDTLTYSANGLPPGLSIDAGTGVISGTLDRDASQGGTNGTYTVTITADDGHGGTVDMSFDWTVSNPAPIADNDTGATTENSTTTGNVLTNDSDPDGDDLIVSQVNGEASDVGEAVDGDHGGQFTLNEDGSYSFDPNGDFDDLAVGETRTTSIEYQVSDGEGGFDTATLEITVTGVNDAPTVVTGNVPEAQSNDDSDTVTPLDVSGAFADVDGSDTLTYSADGLPPGLSIDTDTGIISGTLDRDASQGGTDGTYTVTVTADDGNGGTVDISFDWTVSNPAPVADNDTGTTNENSTTTGNVLTNDSDPDGDDLTVSQVNGEAGEVGEAVDGDHGGQFTLNEDGSYTFDPDGDFDDLAVGESRTTSIEYQVSDGEGGFDTATLTITVTGVNDAPTVVTGNVPEAQSNDDSDTVTPLDVSGAFADVDGSDTLTYSADGLPPGLSIDTDTGIISGTLDRDASQGGTDGTYTVTVTADDGNGGTVEMSFDWTVSNPAPIADNDTGATTENTTTTGNVLTNDSDPDGDDLTVSAVNGEAGEVGEAVDGDHGGRFTLNQDGSYSFDPNGDFDDLAVGETRTTSIEYQVSDGEGGFDTATLTITVTGVNDAPTVVNGNVPDTQSNDDSDTVTPLDVSGAFADVDGTDTLTYSADGLPPGLSIDTDTGIISGTLDRDASQGGTDGTYTVTITADDGNGGTVDISFDWTVSNPAPIADNDTGATNEDTTTTGNVLTNDSDPDGDDLVVSQVGGDAGNVGEATDGSHGGRFTINQDGSYSFDPNGDFDDLAVGETRTTSIEYQVSDGEGGFDTATLEITVTGVNDAPTVVTGNAPTDQNGRDAEPVEPLDVSGAFTDVDGTDTLTYSANGLPPGLSIDPATGIITGTPERSASQGGVGGTYTVTVTASDGNGGSVQLQFNWTIANPAPVASDDGAVADELTGTGGNVLDNDQDPDGDPITVDAVNGDTLAVGQWVRGDQGGRFQLQADGSFRFDPRGDFRSLNARESRDTSIQYRISDGEGGFDTATLTVRVDGRNDPYVPTDPTPTPPDPQPPIVPDRGTEDIDGDGDPFSGRGDDSLRLGGDYDDYFELPEIQPIELRIALRDVVANEDIYLFALPANTFHSESDQPISVEATQADGSPLPAYITFDTDSQTFRVDRAQALTLGVERVDVKVVGHDLAGNEASDTFVIHLLPQNEKPVAEKDQPEPAPTASADDRVGVLGEPARPMPEKGAPSLAESLAVAGHSGFAGEQARVMKDLMTLLAHSEEAL
ncbi:Ig-like domain-containing protein [Alloalcanivorax sp. C16-1]|uniref:Ig-like domain-containing protein n=1 Tax=Alloalcanivorax sp. C16-1 TaxID=3390051 RepID=UPI003970CA45